MSQFKAYSPNVEVNGETVLSVVDGMGAMKKMALGILETNGIKDPKPGQWFKQQAWLDAFKKISESIGANTLSQIGQKIPENAQFPPGIDTIEKALSVIDVAYHMNHRGGEIGHYNCKTDGSKKATMECVNPYPCDFDRGIIVAMARRFGPQGGTVRVTHDDTKPCRKKGEESCTYNVAW
ncbi:MAG: hypothetical protein ACLQDL_16990 [Spirochaetia bacterium]